MKKNEIIIHIVYACLLVLTAGVFSGCKDDDLVRGGGQVVEGVPVTATLKLSGSPTADIVVNTRADNTLSHLAPRDLTIFIFDGNGNYQQTVSAYDNPPTLDFKETSKGDDGVINQVTFNTTSGKKKMLALGNLISSYWWKDNNVEILEKAYNGEYNFDELKEAVFEMNVKDNNDPTTDNFYVPIQIASDEQMFVSGWNEGLVIGTDGNVSEWGDRGIPGQSVGVQLERSMARITFKIKDNLSPGNNDKGNFIPERYTVYNIPMKSHLANMRELTTQKRKVTPNGAEFINFSEYIPAVSNGEYTFEFYMPENICSDVTGLSSYNDREKWEDLQDGSGTTALKKTWTNAPQNSTFVVISGTYTGTAAVNGTEKNVSARVEYTIHLGYFNDDVGYGNFSVERNGSYTYNVTVKGVDNIIVEALKGDEDKWQHGAEGTVYDYTSVNYLYNLDAHYEQVFLEYDLSAMASAAESAAKQTEGYGDMSTEARDKTLDDAIAQQLVLVISSAAMSHVSDHRASLRPYQIYRDAVSEFEDETSSEAIEAAKKAKEDIMEGDGQFGVSTKGFDYRWIEFWPQTGTTLASYPGISTWAKENLEGMLNEDFYADNVRKDYGKSGFLMDVYDVIVEMGKKVKELCQSGNIVVDTDDYNDDGKKGQIKVSQNDDRYVARFTAFVNEFYYLRHPLTGEKVTTWSTFVNKDPREMTIAMSMDKSTDGNSSYSRIHSYISQLSMETFYLSKPEYSINAFGIETYNETPLDIKFGSPVSQNILSPSDGRENQKTLIGASLNPEWNLFISVQYNGWIDSENATTEHSKHKLTDAYANKSAYSACLSRNRDLNGNGTIEGNEIRWYLASVNEYIRIGIGSQALSASAQLYISDKTIMERDHYPDDYVKDGSLFYTSSDSDHRIYWAVEKGAYGKDYPEATWVPNVGKPIRCIRTLPAHTDSRDISSLDGVQSDATFEPQTKDGNRVLIFRNRLTENLYRARVSGSLGIHNEDSPINRFYQGIYVAPDIVDNCALGEVIGYSGTMTNPCATYSDKVSGHENWNWRVPNLVEILAMYVANTNSTNFEYLPNGAICCTQFTNMNLRYGFGRDGTYIIGWGLHYGYWYDIENKDDKGGGGQSNPLFGLKVRCVRDVEENFFDNN